MNPVNALTRCANKKIMVFGIQISAFHCKKLLFCQPELVEGYQLRMLRLARLRRAGSA